MMISKEFYQFINNPENNNYSNEDTKLKKARELLGVIAKDKTWTESDDLFIKQHYKENTDKWIASFLNKSTADIKNRRKKLGLMKRNKN